MSVAAQSSPSKVDRLVLIDLFRITCVFFIVVFHSWEFFIGSESSVGQNYFFFRFLEVTHVFLFNRAGIWIATTSFFLFGYIGGRLSLWRVLFCLVGIMAVQFVGEDGNLLRVENYSWGVFSFILTGYWVLMVTKYFPFYIRRVIHLLLATLIFIPHTLMQTWIELPHGILKQALIGDYLAEDWATGWFLFPWLGALLLSFEAGFYFRHFKNFFQSWSNVFDYSFLILLLASLAALILRGPEFSGGSRFNHAIFWVEPIDLAYVVLFPIWIYRLSQIKNIQNALAKSRLAQKISQLCWNQHFWFCYILHLCLIFVIQGILPTEISRSPWVVQPMGPLIMLCIEIFGYYFFKRQQNYKKSIKLSLEN